jgi:hypothetical protein
VQAHGGDVIGGMEIRRDDLEGGAVELARRLVDALASPDPLAAPAAGEEAATTPGEAAGPDDAALEPSA